MAQSGCRSGHICFLQEKEAVNEAVNETVFAAHTAPEPGHRASIWLPHFLAISATQYGKKPTWTLHDGVDPWGVQIGRRTTQIRIRPATADPMPTARRMLSGVASALFMARRIQAGLAANIKPSITNRMPTPMRKSENAMDLIGLEPPICCFYWRDEA